MQFLLHGHSFFFLHTAERSRLIYKDLFIINKLLSSEKIYKYWSAPTGNMNSQREENLQAYLTFTSFFMSSRVRSTPSFYTLPEGKLQLQNVSQLNHTMDEEQILRKLGAV